MQDSVLNLGEKVVLAARLAAIEHVRQMLEEVEHPQDQQQGERRDGPGGAPAERFKDEPMPQTLHQLARTMLTGLVMPTSYPALRGAA